jgi:hypothetical protein
MPAGAAVAPPEVHMPRSPSRLFLPTLALIALVLLVPAIAMALPPDARELSAAERAETTPCLLSQLWGLFHALWSENGSGLDPDGGANSGAPSKPEPSDASTGDTGPGLEPNG